MNPPFSYGRAAPAVYKPMLGCIPPLINPAS
jgi:hypothetical protein